VGCRWPSGSAADCDGCSPGRRVNAADAAVVPAVRGGELHLIFVGPVGPEVRLSGVVEGPLAVKRTGDVGQPATTLRDRGWVDMRAERLEIHWPRSGSAFKGHVSVVVSVCQRTRQGAEPPNPPAKCLRFPIHDLARRRRTSLFARGA
jgi:hypothetical protein